MRFRALVLNRFVVTSGTLALVILIWNLYVVLHDNGVIEGRVVDVDGNPAAGATVVLARRTIASVDTVAETTTDAEGDFLFSEHGQYSVVLSASGDGGVAARITLPLWFRDQDVLLQQPLVLRAR